jgi:hypothetical protein
MIRTDLTTFEAGPIQLFCLAKMYLIRPLSATFGNSLMGFFYSAISSSIRPKSAKMDNKKAMGQPWMGARKLT